LRGNWKAPRIGRRLALALSLLLLGALAVHPVLGERYSIDVVLPPTKYPPIKVYWDESSMASCPRDLSETIFETMKVAMAMLRKSIYRFAEESDGRYDELVRIRFENTSKPDGAHIILRVSQLGEGVAGRTTYRFRDGQPYPPYTVEVDCEVPLSGTVPAFNVVLHELLHSLGLGHTKHYMMPDGGLEIMAETKPVEREPTIYVSTLDLYALYRIYFGGHVFWGGTKDTVEIESEKFSYRQVTPYVVEFDALRRRYDELSSKYTFLEGRYVNLSRDLEVVSISVKSLESSISKVSSEVQGMSKTVSSISESVSSISTRLLEEEARRMRLEEALRRNMSTVQESLEKLRRENLEMNETIASLGEEASRLRESLKQAYMEIDILRGQNIMLTLLALAALAVAVAEIPLIVKSAERRGEKPQEPERGGG